MTDLLPNKAYQITGKVDQHFNEAISLSGFLLRQVTHEANSNYNPVNKFVGTSYQLDRVIKTFVVNNTYILNSSTVLTLRGGYNHFDDNYNLPYPFDATALFKNPALTSAMSDTDRFPSMAITGYKSTGFNSRQANGYYQYGANGTLSKLAGSHSFKAGGDYRTLGTTSLNYGASTGTYNFTGGFSGNALADLLLGYPQGTSNVPLNTQLDGFVRYFSGYVQDDWRVSNKLTFTYGLRLEHETGLDGTQQPVQRELRSDGDQPAQQLGERARPGYGPAPPDPRRPRIRRCEWRADPTRQSARPQGRASRRSRSTALTTRPSSAAAGACTTRPGTTRQVAPTHGARSGIQRPRSRPRCRRARPPSR